MSRKIIKHGTRNTYERHKCRCDECRAANTARHTAWRTSNLELARELGREHYARHKETILARQKQRREEDPQKNVARCKVTYALRKGWIKKGECEVGDDCLGAVQAHHEDYSKPLEVRWFCFRHHQLLHHRGESVLVKG